MRRGKNLIKLIIHKAVVAGVWVCLVMVSGIYAGSGRESTLPSVSFKDQSAAAFRILALGDSYTIGQGVRAQDRWPSQLADSIGQTGAEVEVVYVARTGWTTQNLLDALGQNPPQGTFDLVTLLIGVNNQFQGLPFSLFEQQFPQLINLALSFVDSVTERVQVVSIPDYGYTPFGLRQSAEARTRISQEIDRYNQWKREYASSREISFADITPITRRGLDQPELVAGDGLHPSALAYQMVAQRVFQDALCRCILPDM